jgi:hypothetical protein
MTGSCIAVGIPGINLREKLKILDRRRLAAAASHVKRSDVC